MLMWINFMTIDFIIYIKYDIHKTNYQNDIQKAVIFLNKYKKLMFSENHDVIIIS